MKKLSLPETTCIDMPLLFLKSLNSKLLKTAPIVLNVNCLSMYILFLFCY